MNSKQQQLFDSVLTRIPAEGWTPRAFAAGAKAAGVSVDQAQRTFPQGIADIAAGFQAMIDNAMHDAIQGNRKFAALRVRDKIAFALRARLTALTPHREIMRRLLVWSVLPKNIRAAATQLWHSADTIWLAAGDTSTDTNFYTKRILLIAVMKAVLSFWLNDTSTGCAATWEFLDRRITDVLTVGKGIGVMKTVGLGDMVSFIRSRFKSAA